ncbi:MAG: hypothetical protein PQJ58_09825 [Spirochaetales bacterium]|nr:hypothetical protein [Spirochaetales bacterium]
MQKKSAATRRADQYAERGSLWNYIVRFDLDQRHPYSHPHAYHPNNSRELRNGRN